MGCEFDGMHGADGIFFEEAALIAKGGKIMSAGENFSPFSMIRVLGDKENARKSCGWNGICTSPRHI